MIMKNIIYSSLFLFTTIIYSQGQAVSYAVANATIESISEEVQEAITSIDNLKTNMIGDSANALLTLIGSLEESMGNTIGKADRVLSKRENEIFNKIISLQTELDKSIQNSGDQIERVSLNISQALNDFFGKNREPTIMSIKTKPYIEGFTTRQRFKIIGSNFERADTIYLKLGNKIVPFDTRTTNNLEFEMPVEDYNSMITDKQFIKGEIHSKWREGWFKKKKNRTSPFIIPVFPNVLGSVEIKYEQNRPYKALGKIEEYTIPPCTTGSRRVGGSRRKSSSAFNLVPSAGKLFNVAAVRPKDWTQRYGGEFRFFSVTEQQIKGEITCMSETKVRGGGGYSSGKVVYQEYKKKYPVKDFETKEYKITATNPLIVELPSPIDTYSARVNYATIKTYDNKTIILVPNGRDEFFTLQHNMDTDDVVIDFKGR